MKKRLIVLLLSAALLVTCMAGCGSPSGSGDAGSPSKPETPSAATPSLEEATTDIPQEPAPAEEAPSKTEFAVGETWTVDGQWELTVTGVTETQDRNQFSDKAPAAVYLVDYVYTNLGYSDPSGIMGGLYISMDDGIVDSTGVMGYSYPGDTTYFPQETPAGASCKAQTCIGVDNGGAFTVNVTMYDGNGEKQTATFMCDPSAAPVEIDVSTSGLSNENAIPIGETWTVDGQWSLTITGVTATEERNEFSDKSPAAVYVVDYTYTNIGYVDDSGIMDGLFFSMDDGIVDSAGAMGYSYPGDISNYPTETPIDATCNAQVCIGVDNAGSFQLQVSQYDGTGTEQSATFYVEVN